MSMNRSMKRWAGELASRTGAGEMPPPEVVAAFAAHYLQIAEHADRQIEAAALFMEARAQMMRLETRHDMVAEAQALTTMAGDLRAGMHMLDDAPHRRIYAHADGGLYEMHPLRIEVKNDATGDWDEGVAYRSIATRREVLYVTSQQRFDDRFLEVADPDA